MRMSKFVFWTTLAMMMCVVGVMWPVVAFGFTIGDPADPNVWATQWWGFISKGEYAAALGPGIMVAVWVLRKYDLKIPKYGAAIDAFLNQPLIAFAAPTVLAAFGGFGTAVAAGQPLSAAIAPTLKAAGTAVFTFVMLKQGGEQLAAVKLPTDPPAAPPAPDPKPTAPGGAP